MQDMRRKIKSLSYLNACDLCGREATDYAVEASVHEQGVRGGHHLAFCLACARGIAAWVNNTMIARRIKRRAAEFTSVEPKEKT